MFNCILKYILKYISKIYFKIYFLPYGKSYACCCIFTQSQIYNCKLGQSGSGKIKNCSSSDDHLRLAPKEHPKKAPKVFGANFYFLKTIQDGIFLRAHLFNAYQGLTFVCWPL